MGYKVRDFMGDAMAGLQAVGGVGGAIMDKRKADLLAKEGALRIKESEQAQKLNAQKIAAGEASAADAANLKQIDADTERRGALTPKAMEGVPTPTGNAVDFQEVVRAKQDDAMASKINSKMRDPQDSEARLYATVYGGMPLSGGTFRKMIAAKALESNRADQVDIKKEETGAFELGEKKAKAGREAAESTASLAETRARTGLLGAQTLKAKKEADAPPDKAKDLPLDVKSEVAGISGKNAGKISVANQIDGYLKEFKAAKTEDDKVRIGRQMLKVINSSEGADAIAVEEAKRLGDALEYNIADVGAGLGMKTGKFHGRDLDGFEAQAQSTLDAIRRGVTANRTEVDRLMGREATQAPLDDSDPRVKAAKAAGYTDDEIRAYMGGRK